MRWQRQRRRWQKLSKRQSRAEQRQHKQPPSTASRVVREGETERDDSEREMGRGARESSDQNKTEKTNLSLQLQQGEGNKINQQFKNCKWLSLSARCLCRCRRRLFFFFYFAAVAVVVVVVVGLITRNNRCEQSREEEEEEGEQTAGSIHLPDRDAQ